MLGWLKSIFARTVDPYDQFVVALAEECKRQGLTPAGHDPVSRSFTFRDPQGFTNLENFFRIWLVTPLPERSDHVARFAHSIRESRESSAIDPLKLPGELLPAVRTRYPISTTLIQTWILGAPEESAEVAYAPLAGELVACLVRDKVENLRLVLRSDLDFAKVSFDAALQHAMANFRARNPIVRFEVDPRAPGLFYCDSLKELQSSVLLLDPGEDYALPDLLGEPVVVVPSRNQFFVTGSDNMAGLDVLLTTAERASQLAYYCSSQMLIRRGKRWEPYFFPAGTAAAERQARMSAETRHLDYQSQKRLLDQLHDKLGRDIFVASHMLWEKADGNPSRVSMTTLSSGATGTLVPEADRIMFVDQIIDPATGRVDDKPRDVAMVMWTDAMAIVGHLFEPVPGLYPPRFRALGFPGSDAWFQLKQKTL
jgi:hypothetical protein